MPSDIRSFFGGKPAGTPAEKPKELEKGKKRGRARKVVDDDGDEYNEPASARGLALKLTLSLPNLTELHLSQDIDSTRVMDQIHFDHMSIERLHCYERLTKLDIVEY